ncbi:MAG: hypothetical protein H7248_05385 [Microbacteriaceae bacterium]|nr:hypothetical protein [Microbacteriaceae bacterium]
MSEVEPDIGNRRARVVALAVATALATALVAGIVISNRSASGGSAVSPAQSASASPSALLPLVSSPSVTPSASLVPDLPSAAAPNSTVARPPKIDPLTKKPMVLTPVGERAAVIAGVTATVSQLTAVTGEARSPGDIAGPSVHLVLTIANSTRAAISLSSAVVNLFYGDSMTPASSLPGPDVFALPEALGAGQSTTAQLVFSVPPTERKNLTISLDYSVEAPLIAFVGPGPAA